MARSIVRTSRGAVALVLAVALTGCGGVTPAPSGSPTSDDPRATPTPVETEHTDARALPASCDTLASDDARSAAVGDMTLQSNGEGFVRPAPEGAQLALGCDWISGDATGMLLLISTADPAAVADAVAQLPSEGYACQMSEDFGADFCALPGSGADTEELVVAREDVWIYLSTAQRNGRAFLSEIVQGIFG
jgi:hypothetical protein